MSELVVPVDLSLISTSPFNMRKIDENDQTMQGLVSSIRAEGVLQPASVRPIDGGRYQLIFGERRYRASRIAGLTSIPCIIRELNDQQAMIHISIENLQRNDLRPLEEAESIQQMVESGYDVKSIADSLGRSPGWVYRRAELMRLTKDWQNAWTAIPTKKDSIYVQYGPGIHNWPSTYMEEVARLPVETQEKLYSDITNKCSRRPSLDGLRRAIADLTRILGKAAFDLTDPELTKAPACTVCPKREGMRRDLFDITEEVPVEKDRCLDGACYEKKSQAHARQLLKAEKAADPRTIEIKQQQGYWGSTENRYQSKGVHYAETKKKDPDAIPAVVTSKEGRGRKIYVKETGRDQSRAAPTVEELRELLNRERARTAYELFEERLRATGWNALSEKKNEWDLLRLLCMIGGAKWDRMHDKINTTWEKAGNDKLLSKVWEGIQEQICVIIEPPSWERDTRLKTKKAKYFCAWLGWTWKTFVDQAKEQYPEPEEWKTMKEADPASNGKESDDSGEESEQVEEMVDVEEEDE